MLYRFRWFMVAFSMVLALAPFSGIAVAALLAPAFGCVINDAAPQRCDAFGIDFSPLLSAFVQTANLGEIVFSMLIVILAFWIVIEGIALAWRRWRRSRARARAGSFRKDPGMRFPTGRLRRARRRSSHR